MRLSESVCTDNDFEGIRRQQFIMKITRILHIFILLLILQYVYITRMVCLTNSIVHLVRVISSIIQTPFNFTWKYLLGILIGKIYVLLEILQDVRND